MSGLQPPWVYDLIAALAKHEDEHGQGHPCFAAALDRVPAVERDRAAAIDHYRHQAPPPVIEFPADMAPEDAARFKAAWDARQGGPVEWRQAGKDADA